MHKPVRTISILAAFLIVLFLIPVITLYTSAAPEPAPIRLKYATFQPSKGEKPEIPPGLSIAENASSNKGYFYYIVQFAGPVEESWKSDLAGLGVEILEYIPDFAFKVRMPSAIAQQVKQMSQVAFVDFFQPAYKQSQDLQRTGVNLFKVRIERGADLSTVAQEITASGVQVLGLDGQSLLVAADSSQLDAVARVLDVAWIENFHMFEKHNETSAGTIMGAANAYALGYDGSTQIVAVADTGLGGGTPTTAHIAIPSSRITSIFNWPGINDSCWSITNDGAIDVDSGHGTHVAVSVVGDGSPTGAGKGTAPGARLVFQATENWATMLGVCGMYYPNGYYLTGIPSDLRTLFQQAYTAGARIHSNSWGSAAAGDYTADSAYADEFIWYHPDMLISFSAGNEGMDANGDGVVDNDSLGSPATAKNVLTVGASENARPDSFPCDPSLGYTTCASQGGINSIFTWGSAWPSDYPANPLRDDASAGNAQQMAAFSSRGPSDDGRIKPDLVAPGSWILSGYSDLYQQGYDASANPKNGAWQYDGYGFPYSQYYKYLSGTSMSNPLAAGGAAVVRDFFQKAYGLSASSALVKAMLINSATDMLDENNDGANDNDFPIPNYHEGWGLVNLANATDGTAQYIDQTSGLTTGNSASYSFNVSASGASFKVTLVWSDYPSTEAATANLVNDLDLLVTSPSGAQYRGNVFGGGWTIPGGSADRVNNVENVHIQSAQSGIWTVQVTGYNIPHGPQPFALVADGVLGEGSPTPTPAPTNTPAPTATATPIPSPTAAPVSTGFISPSANAAVRTGDRNGFETTPQNAYLSDNLYAIDANSGSGTTTACNNNKKDRHIYSGFNFTIPTAAAILGIEVKVEGKADSAANSPFYCIELSWDGGATWAVAKTTGTLSTSDTVFTLGSASDLWNRTWLATDFASSKFQVRITPVSSSISRDFFLDWLAVNVIYRP